MDPFLVLLHSLSGSLSGSDLMELKFLCRERVSKRKLERMQSGLDLFSVLLEQNDLERGRTGLLRDLLASLRRHDLLQRLDDFEAGAAAAAAPGEAGGLGAGGGWGSSRRAWGRGMGGEGLASVQPLLALTGMGSTPRPLLSELRNRNLGGLVSYQQLPSFEPRLLLVPSRHSPTTCPTPRLTRIRPAVLGWKTQLRNGCD